MLAMPTDVGSEGHARNGETVLPRGEQALTYGGEMENGIAEASHHRD